MVHSQKATETWFGTLPFEKQTTVWNEIVFLILMYLHERGHKQRAMFVTLHVFASPRTAFVWTECLCVTNSLLYIYIILMPN